MYEGITSVRFTSSHTETVKYIYKSVKVCVDQEVDDFQDAMISIEDDFVTIDGKYDFGMYPKHSIEFVKASGKKELKFSQ